MKKNLKENLKACANQVLKKIPRQPKDFIPSNMLRTLRDNIPITCHPSKLNENNSEYIQLAQPFCIPQEWNYTHDEEVNKEILSNLSEGALYEDPQHDLLTENLPLNLIQCTNNIIQWIRPTEYVKNYYIDQDIKRLYPKKKYILMREDIKGHYKNMKDSFDEEDNDVEDFLRKDSATRKKNIYKDFYKLLEKPYDFRVVNWKFREETEEEFKKRKEDEAQEALKLEQLQKSVKKGKEVKVDVKSKKQAANKNMEEHERLKFCESTPSNINVNELCKKEKVICQNTFVSWVSSIFQLIIDLDIKDVTTGRNIFSNIYPQKDGLPIYNPKGKYIIKLYFMGKPRKIEIDDRIPCNKDEEYILPQCEFLEEIWPALLTKALLKLNMYKARHPYYYANEELTDPSYIHALTGYNAEIINIEQNSEDMDLKLVETFENCLSDDVVNDQKKFLICLRQAAFQNEISDSYETIMQDCTRRAFMNEIENADSEAINKCHAGIRKTATFFKLQKNNSLNINMPVIRTLIKRNTTQFNYGGSRIDCSNKKINTLKLPNEGLPIDKSLSTQAFIEAYKRNQKRKNTEEIKKTYTSKEPEFCEQLLVTKDNVILDFAYSICDFFNNKKFNMNRIKPLDFSDLRKEIKDARVCFKKLNATEKKEYFQYRRELKAKHMEEKSRRIEELKKEGKKITLVKVKNEVKNGPKMNFFLNYTEEEIYMAKKCILNKWEYPPPSFFEKHFEQATVRVTWGSPARIEREISSNDEASVDFSRVKGKTATLVWNREAYLQLISNNVEQYFMAEEPVIQHAEGVWMPFSEFKKLFNRFIILHHPGRVYLGGRMLVDNSWNYYRTDAFEPLEDHSVFFLGSSNITVRLLTYSVFITFEPNTDQGWVSVNKIYPYLTVDVVDSQGTIIKENIILNKFYSTYHISDLSGEMDYYIVLKGGVFPVGYMLQIQTESHSIENISHNAYLKKMFGFSLQNFKVDHPNLEKNKFYLISRYSISPIQDCSDPGEIKLKFTIKYPIKFVKNFIEIFIQKAKSQNKKKIYMNEIIKLGIPVLNYSILSTEDNNLNVKNLNWTYFVTIGIKSPNTIKENAFEIEILNDNKNFKIEQIEHIDPYEVSDKFIPMKHGIIFKEYIYASDLIHCSLDVKLRKITEGMQITQEIASPTGKKNSVISAQPFHASTIEEKQIEEKVRMKLELYSLANPSSLSWTQNSLKFSYTHTGELLHSWEFFNEFTIHHLSLEGSLISLPPMEDKKKKGNQLNLDQTALQANSNSNSNQNPPYLLICYMDMDEYPHWNEKSKIGWVIRVFSSDTLGFVKDTSKEDHEKFLKESWEVSEPGRAEKAKKARQKFLLAEKKLRKEKLTEEEEILVTEERERKITRTQPTENSSLINIRSQKKGSIFPRYKPLLIDTPVPLQKVAEKPLVHQRPLPMPESHKSEYITDYLCYTYQERTIKFNTLLDQNDKVIIDEAVKAMKLQEINSQIDVFANYYRKTEDNEHKCNKEIMTEKLKSFYKTSSSSRSFNKDNSLVLTKSRDKLKNEFQMRIECEKNINEILLSNVQNNFDVNYMVTVYKDALTYFKENYAPVIKLFSLISAKKEESIKNELKKLSPKDKNIIVKILEDIEFNKWTISDQVISKLKDLIK